MRSRLAAFAVTALLIGAADALAQRAVGEVHLSLLDGSGAAVAASGTVEGEATQIRRSFETDARGTVTLDALPFGDYTITVARDGFAPVSEVVRVDSSIPIQRTLRLSVAPIQTTVSVTAASDTLANPTRTGSTRYLGPQLLMERPSTLPGRSLIDLVNLQPGWLLEANGILHARGSEYQVQYVIDGIPLRDNRSPAFAQSLGVEEFDSIALRTGGYPAEFGNKLGGVIEVNTVRDVREGLHGLADLQIGSFATAAGHGSVQFGTGHYRAGVSAEGMTTDRYLDPPSDDNFTNFGSARGVAARFERAWSEGSRTRAYAYGRSTEFGAPNETLQQAAGQRQVRTSSEQLAQVSHQQMLSATTLINAGAMTRRTEGTLRSNAASVPIRADQERHVTERYVNASVTSQIGIHELRFGGELTFSSIEETFASTITARSFGGNEVFDDDIPTTFEFDGSGARREHAFFVQDVIRAGRATVSAGLRFDHHRLFLDEQAWSPRLSLSWAATPEVVLHAAYDRTFETQPIEGILLASTDPEELGEEAISRPLRSSRGHFVEGGAAITLARAARLEATVFRRQAQDVTDDELLLNTAVSFPITFASATVKGVELALDTTRWRGLSGSMSYSYSHGEGQLPLTGGLFLDIDDELVEDETFPLSQDQTHTLRTRVRADLGERSWIAAMFRYDSGLPVEVEGDETLDLEALAEQYGADVVEQFDVERGRVRPSYALDLSGGIRVFERQGTRLALQIDALNVLNRLNVINFAGLLSGTALAPPRSVTARLQLQF